MGVTGSKFCDDFDGTPQTGEYALGKGITLDTSQIRFRSSRNVSRPSAEPRL